MIEVVLQEAGPAMVVGEAEDLENIAFLKVADDGETVIMETTDMQEKPLGKLSERAIKGLGSPDAVIVAALFKNTLSWAKEVDFGSFNRPPRDMREMEISMLAEAISRSGFYAEPAIAPETGRNNRGSGRKERQGR